MSTVANVPKNFIVYLVKRYDCPYSFWQRIWLKNLAISQENTSARVAFERKAEECTGNFAKSFIELIYCPYTGEYRSVKTDILVCFIQWMFLSLWDMVNHKTIPLKFSWIYWIVKITYWDIISIQLLILFKTLCIYNNNWCQYSNQCFS